MVPRGFVKASELAPARVLGLLIRWSKPVGREFAAQAPAEDFLMMHASALQCGGRIASFDCHRLAQNTKCQDEPALLTPPPSSSRGRRGVVPCEQSCF